MMHLDHVSGKQGCTAHLFPQVATSHQSMTLLLHELQIILQVASGCLKHADEVLLL